MESLEPKELLLLRILQVLENYSSADHPLRLSSFWDKRFYIIKVQKNKKERNYERI